MTSRLAVRKRLLMSLLNIRPKFLMFSLNFVEPCMSSGVLGRRSPPAVAAVNMAVPSCDGSKRPESDVFDECRDCDVGRRWSEARKDEESTRFSCFGAVELNKSMYGA